MSKNSGLFRDSLIPSVRTRRPSGNKLFSKFLISFYYLNSPSESEYGSETYGSKYQGQEGPTPSRSHTDFKK